MPDEWLKENRSELNQLALEYLKSLKVRLSDNHLYLLQLAQWSLEQSDHGQGNQHEYLESAVNGLLGSGQSAAQEWLLKDDPIQPYELESLSPLEAGQRVVSLVHARLLELDPNYPPRSPA